MQPKDGANGIKLPGKRFLNLSFLFTWFLPKLGPQAQAARAPSQCHVCPALPQSSKHAQGACAEPPKQPAAAADPRVKPVWLGGGGGKKRQRRQRSVTACSLSCWV